MSRRAVPARRQRGTRRGRGAPNRKRSTARQATPARRRSGLRALALVLLGAAVGALFASEGERALARAETPRASRAHEGGASRAHELGTSRAHELGTSRGHEVGAERSTRAGPAPAPLLDLASWLRHPGLTLRQVDFIGLGALPPEPLLARAGLGPGTPLVDVDPDRVCARLAELPRIADCRAARLVPGRLLVRVHERVPLAATGPRQGIDATGVRFPLRGEEARALPRLAGVTKASLALAAAAREAGVAVRRIDAPKMGGLWFQPAGHELRVRVGKDPERALAGWRRVLAEGWLERHAATEIDLRFGSMAVLRGMNANEGGNEDGSS